MAGDMCAEGEFLLCYIMNTEDEMEVKLVISDLEYQDALLQAISLSDKDIYAEVSAELAAEKDKVFVTDNPGILEFKGKESDGYILVYISENIEERNIEPPGPFVLFKYEQISVMLTELVLCNYLATGRGTGVPGNGQMIGVCEDGKSAMSRVFCNSFARHLMFRTDKRVLIVSMRFLNPYGKTEESRLSVHKLFYHFQMGSGLPVDVFFRKDNYDVYYMAGDDGWNFLAGMNFEQMQEIISKLRNCFDYIVFDVGECFSPANVELLTNCRNVFFISEEETRRIYDQIITMFANNIRHNEQVTIIKPVNKLELRCPEYVEDYLAGINRKDGMNEVRRSERNN